MEDPSSEILIHYYDELTEARAAIPTSDFMQFLLKWGYEPNQAQRLCKQFDPNNCGYIRREDICKATDKLPNQPRALRDVKVLTTDMSPLKAQSIMLYVLRVLRRNMSKQDHLKTIKSRIEAVYGEGWNCYMTDGKFYSVCSHKAGSSLVFVYGDIVFGVYQTPGATKQSKQTKK